MRGTRRLRLLLVLLVLTALTLTALDYRAGARSPLTALRRGADSVFGPAQRALGGAAGSVGTALGGLPRLGRYQEDNRRLREDNDRLRSQLLQSADLKFRLEESQRLLGLRDYGTYTMVPAHLIGRGAFFGFRQAITIDVGSQDSVREGQTVASALGLVGRVLRVGPRTATVLLLTDPGFSVGARVAGQGGLGFARGDGHTLVYQQVEGGRAQVGDTLLTGDGTLTRGLPIGRISLLRRPVVQVRTALVQPFVDVDTLDLVGVITSDPAGTPRLPVPSRPVPAPPPTPTPAALPPTVAPGAAAVAGPPR